MSADQIRYGHLTGLSRDGHPTTPGVLITIRSEELIEPGIETRILLLAKMALEQASRCELKEKP